MGKAFEALKRAYSELGLSLHPLKFKIWAPGVPDSEFPSDLLQYRVDSSVALGTTVPYAKRGKCFSACFDENDTEADEDDARVDVPLDVQCLEIAPADFPEKQKSFYERLRLLRNSGMPTSAALKLAEVWSQGAGVHILRAAPVAEHWARQLDDDTGRLVLDLRAGMRS